MRTKDKGLGERLIAIAQKRTLDGMKNAYRRRDIVCDYRMKMSIETLTEFLLREANQRHPSLINTIPLIKEFIRYCNEIERDFESYNHVLGDLMPTAMESITPLLKSVQVDDVEWYNCDTENFFNINVQDLKPIIIKPGMLNSFCYILQTLFDQGFPINPEWAEVCGHYELVIYNGKAVSGRNLQKAASEVKSQMTRYDMKHVGKNSHGKTYATYLKYNEIKEKIEYIAHRF